MLFIFLIFAMHRPPPSPPSPSPPTPVAATHPTPVAPTTRGRRGHHTCSGTTVTTVVLNEPAPASNPGGGHPLDVAMDGARHALQRGARWRRNLVVVVVRLDETRAARAGRKPRHQLDDLLAHRRHVLGLWGRGAGESEPQSA